MTRSHRARRHTRWLAWPRTPNGVRRHEDHLHPEALPETSHIPRGLR